MSEPKLIPVPEANAGTAAAPETPNLALPTPTLLAERPPSAAELRRRRARRLALRFAICVGVPTLIAIVYYGFVATSQYDAHATIAVESSEGRGGADSSKNRDSNAGNQRDARLLRDYIRSHEVLDKVDRAHGLAAHYQDSGIDWWARLDGDAGRDEVHDYLRGKVDVTHEASSNVVGLRVRAFSPAVAQQAAEALVEEARAWIAKLSADAAREQIEPAEREVELARARVAEARKAAPPAGTLPSYDPLVMELELAEKALDDALANLQQTRLEIARADRYLVVVSAPTLPDRASAPKRAWDITTVFVCALVLTGVFSLLGAAVREHANF